MSERSNQSSSARRGASTETLSMSPQEIGDLMRRNIEALFSGAITPAQGRAIARAGQSMLRGRPVPVEAAEMLRAISRGTEPSVP